MAAALAQRTRTRPRARPPHVHDARCVRALHGRSIERYLDECKRYATRKTSKDGEAFKMMPFECASNGIHGNFQWTKVRARHTRRSRRARRAGFAAADASTAPAPRWLGRAARACVAVRDGVPRVLRVGAQIRTRLEALRTRLLAEVADWRTKGAEQTRMLREKHDASVNSCIHHLRQQEERIKAEAPTGASIGPSSDNACVWEATIFGPAETAWDGGMFEVEIVFPPDFPDAPPYVRFRTAMFHAQVRASRSCCPLRAPPWRTAAAAHRRRHLAVRRAAPRARHHAERAPRAPQISPSGVPYLRAMLMWHCCEAKERTVAGILEQLVQLLTADPCPDPATHLNAEAAALLFSRSENERKEYKKRVKKCVQRSVDC
jgi:ubiquitin-protein ligase